MADKTQRKVNKVLRAFNKDLAKDIDPYNEWRLKQVKRVGREPYETMFLVQLYRGDKVVASKWFELYDIVNILNKRYVGPRFFWFINNEVARSANELT